MSEPARTPSTTAKPQQRHEVHRADLPLSCPLPAHAVWNEHPRVYLSIVEDGGQSQCPYCGNIYILVD